MGRHGMVARWAWMACGAVALVAVLAVSGSIPTGLAAQCEIRPRFRVLAEALPELIGNCVASEALNGETGDIEQPVDGGVLVLRSADNTPTFTDGWQTWVAGPNGIETRLNSERLAWELGEASLVAVVDEAAVVPDGGTLLATRPALDVADMYAGVAPSVVKILASDAAGSGVRVAAGIVTNAHVVGDETSVTVVLGDGQQVRGQVVKVDQVADLALVTTEGWIPELEIERASLQRVGDAAYVVGFPLPDKSALAGAASLSRGIISGFRNGSPGVAWIQTDAAVNHGNSGGGLFNAQGKLIGIPSWGFKGAEGLNFAISADTVTAFLARPGSRRVTAPTATPIRGPVTGPVIASTRTPFPTVAPAPTATATMPTIASTETRPKQVFGTWTVASNSCCKDRASFTLGDFPLQKGTYFDGVGDMHVIDSDEQFQWVANQHLNRIEKRSHYRLDLILWWGEGEWLKPGTAMGQFNRPKGITIDRAGNVWVADTGNHRIVRMSPTSSPDRVTISQWGRGGGEGSSGCSIGEYNGPSGVSSDRNGNVWVADTYNHRVVQIAPSGEVLGIWGVGGGLKCVSGSGSGEFDQPAFVTVDPLGDVWVEDTGNRRIQRFRVA